MEFSTYFATNFFNQNGPSIVKKVVNPTFGPLCIKAGLESATNQHDNTAVFVMK